MKIGKWNTIDTPVITGLNYEVIAELENNKDAYICSYHIRDRQLRVIEEDNYIIDNPYVVFIHEDALSEYGYIYDNLFSHVQWQIWAYQLIMSNAKLGVCHKPVCQVDYMKQTDKNPYASVYALSSVKNRRFFNLSDVEYFNETTFINASVSSDLLTRSLNLLNMQHSDKATSILVNNNINTIVIEPSFKMSYDSSKCKVFDENTANVLKYGNNLAWFNILTKESRLA